MGTLQLIRLQFRRLVAFLGVIGTLATAACSSGTEVAATQSTSIPAVAAEPIATTASIPTLVPISSASIASDVTDRIVFVSPDSQIYTI